ncbi:hypothetical protein BDQ17DRAFT_1430524 [Cyathus striatus]|nr:hypothetical protein BDQ17DRAFT_1430524 [Cyathus striatus]
MANATAHHQYVTYIGKGRAGMVLSFVHVSPLPQLVRTPTGVSMGAGTYSINATSATAPIPTAIEAHGNRYTIQAFLPAMNKHVESNIFKVTGRQFYTPNGITYTLPVTTATQHTIPVEISATTVEATAESSVSGVTTIMIAHPITSTVWKAGQPRSTMSKFLSSALRLNSSALTYSLRT